MNRAPDRPVLVGQAPGAAGAGEVLAGRCGRRLAALAGVAFEDYLAAFRRVNVLGEHPGKAGKGDRFPRAEARAEADRLTRRLKGRKVILLGRAVAEAFGLRVPHFKWTRHRGMVAASMPHPSGVNLWWNEQKNVRSARLFLRSSFATK